jgi:hypothetical protein
MTIEACSECTLTSYPCKDEVLDVEWISNLCGYGNIFESHNSLEDDSSINSLHGNPKEEVRSPTWGAWRSCPE